MSTKEDFFLSEEAAEWIGQKKSEYLSRLISQIREDDFGFEQFHQFDELVPQTIQEPDRSYDDHSDSWPIRTFLRTYHQGVDFHQVVVAALIPGQDKSDVVIPVLIFITKKEEVIREWASGTKRPGPILS